MNIVAIAAVAENGVIASDGEIPWDYPADKEFYRETVRGHPVIMGRRTFDGAPKPDSPNIVLSRRYRDLGADVVTVGSVEAAIDAAGETGAETVYVIGGQSVYEAFLDRADRLLITEIPGSYPGDRRFPNWESHDWARLDQFDLTSELRVVEYAP